MNKQIETIAKILCKKTIDCNTCMAIDNLCSCFYQGIAKQLYNAGYCKVNDNEVVLNKDELAELTVQMSLNSKKMAEIRKETAQTIWKEYKIFREFDGKIETFEKWLQKEFGVEV